MSERLTCNITSVNLVGSSPTGAVTYSWTVPGGFSATTAIAPTSTPGGCVLTVTNDDNGCALRDTTIVESLSGARKATVSPVGSADAFTAAGFTWKALAQYFPGNGLY